MGHKNVQAAHNSSAGIHTQSGIPLACFSHSMAKLFLGFIRGQVSRRCPSLKGKEMEVEKVLRISMSEAKYYRSRRLKMQTEKVKLTQFCFVISHQSSQL